ncbi:MAG: hypothetical protein K6F81_02995 [Acholeplasmatales bacterium]|nr:hypothetical protein [Acholeplasmatales bacterium]
MIYFKDYNPDNTGKSDVSKLLNKAIEDSIGDKLIIEKGIYKSSSIFLKSDVEIYLERDAKIILGDNLDDFYDIGINRDSSIKRPTWEDCYYDGRPSKYFIIGKDISNFKLGGEGIIDGSEELFYGKITKYHIEGAYYPRIPLIYIENGKDINIKDITLTRSAFWTLHLVGCDNVNIDSIKIKNNPIFTNCDGIDPDHCKNVYISNCDISCADDCIVLKTTEAFKKYGDSYNINAKNCKLKSTSAAIKIGTESVSSFKDISFSDIEIYDSNRGISIMLRDGASLSNVRFENIKIDNHLVSPINWWGRGEPISITNIKRDNNSILGNVSNISFKDIEADSENGITIVGENLKDISFDNVKLNIKDNKSIFEKKDLDLRPSIYNVKDMKFYKLLNIGCKNLVLNNCNFDVIEKKIEEL